MRVKSAVIALGIAAAWTGITGTSASAYNNDSLSYQSYYYNTGDCSITNPAVSYCHVNRHTRDLDPTFFMPDSGGKAMKRLVYKGNKTVAQIEFHPSDEILWVYDGANDGDSIYVRLVWDEGALSAEDDNIYGPRSTSAEVDSNRIELDSDDDIDEGTEIRLRSYDDKAGTDALTGWVTLRA